MNRVTSQTLPDGRAIAYSYDNNGKALKGSEPNAADLSISKTVFTSLERHSSLTPIDSWREH